MPYSKNQLNAASFNMGQQCYLRVLILFSCWFHFDPMWPCDLHKTQDLISEMSETLYFLINMLQMWEAVCMTPSAYFSGTIPSRDYTDAVIVSQWMLHLPTALLFHFCSSLRHFLGGKVPKRCRTNSHDWGFELGLCTTSTNVKVTQDWRL